MITINPQRHKVDLKLHTKSELITKYPDPMLSSEHFDHWLFYANFKN